MDSIDVRIIEDGRVTQEGRHSLPVRFGRGTDSHVQLASPDRRISRVHVTLEERGGVLVLADTSANGTSYRGRSFKDTEARIEDADEFTLQQYRVEIRRVREPDAPTVFFALVHSHARELKHAIGPASLVLLLDDKRAQIAMVRPKDPAAILAGWAAGGREVLAVIAAKDGFGTITTTPAAAARGLLINRGAPAGDTERLRPLDTVQVGHLRIEILEKDQRALLCKNVTCELLNPYDTGENCRFCGHKLVEARTRLVVG